MSRRCALLCSSRLLLLLLVLAATLPATANSQEALAGKVLDASTEKALPGVVVEASGTSTLTGKDGSFVLSLGPGQHLVKASLSGFQTAEVPVRLAPGVPRPELVLKLARRVTLQDQVDVVVKLAPVGEPGAFAVDPQSVKQTPASGDNVFRVLQTLPGVVAPDDWSSRISVRGGGPDQNLTVMDGVEVHDPFRLFGLTSAFNPEVIEDFTLVAGGFSAEHGDRLSSLLVIDNRQGGQDGTFAGSSSLSITDANVIVEGKLPGNASGGWLLTGRRTYYDLVAERFLDEDLPSFGDLQLKTTWEPSPGRRLDLFGLVSRESADLTFEGDVPGERGALDSTTDAELVSLTFDADLGTRGRSKTIASWYRNVERLAFDGRIQAEYRRSNTPQPDPLYTDVIFDRYLTVRDLALRQELTFSLGAGHLLEGGLELHGLRTELDLHIPGDRNTLEANGSSAIGGVGLPDNLESDQDSTRLGLWLQDSFGVGDRLRLKAGLRLDRSSVNEEITLSPRLALDLELGRSTRLKGAVGLYSQSPGYEKLIQADYLFDLTEAGALDLESERSQHFIVGLEQDLGSGIRARLEGYYKTFDRLIVGRLETDSELAERLASYDFPETLASSVPDSPIITSTPTNAGEGRSWGLDLYVTRRAVSRDTRLTGWISYTLGSAEREAYGRSYPFDYDRRHALSAVGSYRLSRRWVVGLTARVASGFPYSPPVGLKVAATEDILDGDRDGDRSELIPELDTDGLPVYTPDLGGVENLNSGRYPYYARFDVRLTFLPGGLDGRWEIYFEAINVTNRKNAGLLEPRLEHDPEGDLPRLREVPEGAVPFLPSFGVRFRF